MDLLTRRRSDIVRHTVMPPPRRRVDDVILASAQIVMPSRNLRLVKYPWQTELWNYYREGIGAFKYAMLWHTQTMSRVRLVAALQKPTGEPPEPVTDGPAAEAMLEFYGGPSGQSQYMAMMDLQLQVPGEGYVVGYRSLTGEYEWCVHSREEINVVSAKSKRHGTAAMWQIQVDEGVWRTLPEDSYVFRQWIADPERQWRPDSPSRGALPVLRLIDMIERRIMSQAVSRLAMNGFLKYAQEITFTPNPKFKDQPDPFIAELLDIAEQVIANPGSALAAMPLPIKVPAEYFDKFEHVPFANPFDEKVMDLLNTLYDKLSVSLNMPKEVVTGMGETSHWNAWSLDEQGIETHIKPPAEQICQGLTKAYLKPWLTAAGAPLVNSEGEFIVWYDTRELDVPPDLSEAADSAFDRLQIGPNSYRAAKGFSDEDEPSKQEMRAMLLLQAVKSDPSMVKDVVKELTGLDVNVEPPAPAPAPPGQEPADQPAPDGAPPAPPASPGQPTSQPSVPAGG